jgi:hypothetical protein
MSRELWSFLSLLNQDGLILLPRFVKDSPCQYFAYSAPWFQPVSGAGIPIPCTKYLAGLMGYYCPMGDDGRGALVP